MWQNSYSSSSPCKRSGMNARAKKNNFCCTLWKCSIALFAQSRSERPLAQRWFIDALVSSKKTTNILAAFFFFFLSHKTLILVLASPSFRVWLQLHPRQIDPPPNPPPTQFTKLQSDHHRHRAVSCPWNSRGMHILNPTSTSQTPAFSRQNVHLWVAAKACGNWQNSRGILLPNPTSSSHSSSIPFLSFPFVPSQRERKKPKQSLLQARDLTLNPSSSLSLSFFLLTACKFSTPTTTDIVRIQQAFLEFQVRERKETSPTTKPSLLLLLLLLLLPISYTPRTFPETDRVISDSLRWSSSCKTKQQQQIPRTHFLQKEKQISFFMEQRRKEEKKNLKKHEGNGKFPKGS